MRRFVCPNCDNRVWFANVSCEACGTALAYEPKKDMIVAAGVVCAARDTVEQCNWTAPAPGTRCVSCVLDTDNEVSLHRSPFEEAKRRTLRQLLGFGIDPANRTPALCFALLESTEEQPVTTGHQDGVVTLDIAEGDRLELERSRVELGEPYRTPLGHVRHELGHWWWQTAVVGDTLAAFRSLFGDERADYQEALAAHYSTPDDGSWVDTHVSHYAASHPWEDFAESFAHVLHIRDTYETAAAHRLVENPPTAFSGLYERWVDLGMALNELNASMGTPEPYPFAVSSLAQEKMAFVDATLHGRPAPSHG